ncbi:MAG: hypothetical protein CMF23_15530 [Ignavibacteriae bacterium]|jgi:hypothetical protein|nr:hypothetical protein [Ignavibacteriota bacterium]
MEMIPKEIPYRDKSEFLRGFLLLIRQDKKISKYERNMTLVIGKYFGFDEEFCEESIDSILVNEYVSNDPPQFSSKSIAKYFVLESYNILKQIHLLTDTELEWLRKTAEANHLKGELENLS